jgi:hypothetical protein
MCPLLPVDSSEPLDPREVLQDPLDLAEQVSPLVE